MDFVLITVKFSVYLFLVCDRVAICHYLVAELLKCATFQILKIVKSVNFKLSCYISASNILKVEMLSFFTAIIIAASPSPWLDCFAKFPAFFFMYAHLFRDVCFSGKNQLTDDQCNKLHQTVWDSHLVSSRQIVLSQPKKQLILQTY